MNSKNSIFLSVSLTAFTMAVIFGVVTRVANSSPQVVSAAPAATSTPLEDTATPTDQPTNVATATTLPALSYDEAATIAAKAINRQDVYSVETATYLNVESFKVVFSSGDVVFIGLNRQVLAAVPVTPAIAAATPIPQAVMQTSFQSPIKPKRKSSGENTQSSSGSSGEPSEPHDD